MRRRHGIAMVGLAVLVLASSAGAAETKLAGTVGPGFTIELRDAQGQPVKQLQPGVVEIEVSDRSVEHDFHLQGPGVDVTTGVDTTGDTTFTVTLGDGRYTFLCDVHPTQDAGHVRRRDGRTRRRPCSRSRRPRRLPRRRSAPD